MQAPVNLLEPSSGFLAIATVLFFLAIAAVPVYFIFRFLRAYERRGAPATNAHPNADARIATLEAQVERLTSEMEQLAEGQRFTSQLLQRPRQMEQVASQNDTDLLR